MRQRRLVAHRDLVVSPALIGHRAQHGREHAERTGHERDHQVRVQLRGELVQQNASRQDCKRRPDPREEGAFVGEGEPVVRLFARRSPCSRFPRMLGMQLIVGMIVVHGSRVLVMPNFGA